MEILFIIILTMLCIFLDIKNHRQRKAIFALKDRIYTLVTRAGDIHCWCGSEFPQMADAALFIANMELPPAQWKYVSSYHRRAISEFREHKRNQYTTKKGNQ